MQRVNTLLRHVPDIPRWVETRSLLLSDRCEIFGDGDAFIVAAVSVPLMGIVGKPEASIIRQATAGRTGNFVALAPPENQNFISEILTDWKHEPAILHLLSGNENEPPRMNRVRFISEDEIPEETPAELREELTQAMEWSSVAATVLDEKPVSFCYAGSITETLWDISIDTLEAYRGRGLAIHCVAFMIDLMKRRGQEPVWGSMESNTASLRLAQKLGFEPVDRLSVFTKL